MNLFFDTSALVKYFHREDGSDKVEALIDAASNVVWISDLARIEALSAFHRRFRMGEIDASNLERAVSGFEQELARFNVQPLNGMVLAEASSLIKSYSKKHSLRTLDAIQLAVFVLLQDDNWHFVLADDGLYQVLMAGGFPVIKV
jgi:predicted nucleic acid-binding protein